ncbi:GntR family transcriptional regulator [Oceanobacillus alkalisoli]|uniref:GntR family transcriptional regulator n=1 Tax=Oceanobacillus alkalisoli TaxID=2925113 RepID=UPI001EE4E441|nr:GntR family transcriptional regulator [Oceanobacillus alkalisoli]MCG5103220.1 GntR family transcriptional regulator [Oceanobacillus alkalisoli]
MDYPEKWLKNDTLGEKIINNLRLNIISGEIPTGTILTEKQVSTNFQTSRSPVREALKVLANEGLIDLGRMGAKVLGLTEKDVDELYDVRFLLENFAFQRVMNDFDEEKVRKYTKIVQKMELSAEQDDYLEFSYYDLLFHESIILDTNHKRILYTWNNIRHLLLCLLIVATKKRFAEEKDQIYKLVQNHEHLINVLHSQDSDRLYSLIDEHFIDTKQTVGEAYFSEKKGVAK